jgi:NADH-quinone oxidoreductase subunit G
MPPEVMGLASGSDQMVKLTIDGKEITAPKGTWVIEAARRAGIDVPHYCYHPYLTVAGNCRMCLVEIEKMPKLQIACSMQVAEGMVVRTGSPQVLAARAGVMEFLLINHPLDCPICDQAGECRLQEYSVAHGTPYSRFDEPKEHGRKNVDLGPHVVFDEERCIKCTRCVRFCDEVTKTGELALFNRGDRAIIGTFPGRSLDNPYSGNTVDVCPVGALTLREFRFKARVWFLKQTPSICTACARGCNVTLWTQDEKIQRLTPRENPEVNKVWMCDEGRLSYQPLYGRQRLLEPQLDRRGVRWEEAFAEAARLLTPKDGHRPFVGVVASPRASLEELALLRKLCEKTQAKAGLPALERGDDDDILIRRDKSSNRAGARLLGFERSAADVLKEAADGRLDVLYVMEEEIFGPLADRNDADLLRRALSKVPALIVHASFQDRVPPATRLALPAAAYGEAEGTHVNFQGRLQRAAAAVLRSGRARTHLAILAGVARAAEWGDWPVEASSAWAEAQALAAPLRGIAYADTGALGRIPGGAGAERSPAGEEA